MKVDRIWICVVDDGEKLGVRIRAWTTDPARAEQLRAEGLEMVEYKPTDPQQA